MKYIRFFEKWKLVVFILFILSALSSFTVLDSYAPGEIIFSIIICLLIAVVPLLPDIIYLQTPAKKSWSHWKYVEGNKDNLRKGRASYGELTPLYIDTELKYGTFSGSTGGKYRTTLRRCSCPDFKKRKAPCKHMYYIAAKCGVEKLR